MSREIKLSECIGPAYNNVYLDLKEQKHTHYVFKGGRGSLKSSFVFLYIIWSMTKDYIKGEITHCVALRKIKNTIRESLYENFLWAIDLLGVEDYWTSTISPMKLKIGNSTILFRGCANKNEFQRIKSIKFSKGKCKYAAFEETTEFSSMEEIRQINASLFRSVNVAQIFYMFNPPASKKNWCNKEFSYNNKISNRYLHHSTYLTAPKDWLGKIFLEEAEILKHVNPRKYNHMYIGSVVGEGIEIYNNLELRTISNEEIESFDKIYRGFDFGFTKDASCYIEIYYDKDKDKIYIIDEIYGHQLSNQKLYDLTKPKANFNIIRADAAEPRTISELKTKGLNIIKAKKGKDSKDHGIKWLSDLSKIVIDKKRTPFAASDFELYEYEKDKEDNIILEYPKEPHASAAARYALSEIILQKKLSFGGRKK